MRLLLATFTGSSAIILIVSLALSYFDRFDKEFRNFVQNDGGSLCNLSSRLNEDLLAKSAFNRIRTEACKTQLSHQLCSVVYQAHWHTTYIENTCRDLFDPEELYSYVGCYQNLPLNQLLKEFRFNNISAQNPELCVQSCLRAGFSLAGIQLPSECFCESFQEARFLQQQNQPISDEICKACHANDLNCANAVAIYRTGVKTKHFTNKIVMLDSLSPLNNNDNGVPKIKILFLFQLNGRNSRQIQRFLRMIYSPDHLYYIHVDVRQEFMQNEMLKVQAALETRGISNFRVATRRMSTIWGGSSLLELFLWSIAETMGRSLGEKWAEWDYLLNLSETDMPLLSLKELEQMLKKNLGQSFLSSHGYNTGTFLHKQGFHYHFMECEQRMWRVSERNNYPYNLRLDGGSDWVVVHRELAQFAISNSKLASQLRLLFTTILLPLESFFHTLALNSNDFCRRVIYRNLRFTNWHRKQGCRCGSLKPVVDWCGCSPLALKKDETDKKVAPELSRSNSKFFGRKFDSLIDIDPIAFVERTALRFRPEFIPSDQSASFNSFWLNLYSSGAPSDIPSGMNIDLLTRFARSLASSVIPKNCYFQQLNDLYIFKTFSTAPLQSLLSFDASCDKIHPTIQILLNLRNKQEHPISHSRGLVRNGLIVHNGTDYLFDHIAGIEFGVGFDLKEEIFRIYPPVLSASSKFTLKWRWNINATNNRGGKNWTSPPIELILNGPIKNMSYSVHVKPYDSVYGTQFVDIELALLADAIPGLWTAALFTFSQNSVVKLSEISIPVFFTDADEFDNHLLSHFSFENICADIPTSSNINISSCSDAPWSSLFTDEKSIFP